MCKYIALMHVREAAGTYHVQSADETHKGPGCGRDDASAPDIGKAYDRTYRLVHTVVLSAGGVPGFTPRGVKR